MSADRELVDHVAHRLDHLVPEESIREALRSLRLEGFPEGSPGDESRLLRCILRDLLPADLGTLRTVVAELAPSTARPVSATPPRHPLHLHVCRLPDREVREQCFRLAVEALQEATAVPEELWSDLVPIMLRYPGTALDSRSGLPLDALLTMASLSPNAIAASQAGRRLLEQTLPLEAHWRAVADSIHPEVRALLLDDSRAPSSMTLHVLAAGDAVPKKRAKAAARLFAQDRISWDVLAPFVDAASMEEIASLDDSSPHLLGNVLLAGALSVDGTTKATSRFLSEPMPDVAMIHLVLALLRREVWSPEQAAEVIVRVHESKLVTAEVLSPFLSGKVAEHLACRSDTPEAVLLALLRDGGLSAEATETAARQLLRDGSPRAEVWSVLTQCGAVRVCKMVLRHEMVPEQVLRSLSTHSVAEVRAAVAEHSRVPSDVFDELFRRDALVRRYSVSAGASLRLDQWEQACCDPDFRNQRPAARRRDLPWSVVESLLKRCESSGMAQSWIRPVGPWEYGVGYGRAPEAPDVIEKGEWSIEYDERADREAWRGVEGVLVEDPEFPARLHRLLLERRGTSVLRVLAGILLKRTDLTDVCLGRLLDLCDEKGRARVFLHRNAVPEVMKRIGDEPSVAVRRFVAATGEGSDLITQICGIGDEVMLRELMKRRDLSADLHQCSVRAYLEMLFGTEDGPSLEQRLWAAGARHVPVHILERMTGDPSPAVREKVATRSGLPQALALVLAVDPNREVVVALLKAGWSWVPVVWRRVFADAAEDEKVRLAPTCEPLLEVVEWADTEGAAVQRAIADRVAKMVFAWQPKDEVRTWRPWLKRELIKARSLPSWVLAALGRDEDVAIASVASARLSRYGPANTWLPNERNDDD